MPLAILSPSSSPFHCFFLLFILLSPVLLSLVSFSILPYLLPWRTQLFADYGGGRREEGVLSRDGSVGRF